MLCYHLILELRWKINLDSNASQGDEGTTLFPYIIQSPHDWI